MRLHPLASKERRLPAGTLLAALVVLVLLGYYLRAALVPFALSFILAYLVNPIVNVLEARGLRRDRIVLLLYLLAFVAIFTGASLVLPSLAEEYALIQAQAPTYFSRTQFYWKHWQSILAHRLPIQPSMAEKWSVELFGPFVNAIETLPSYLLNLFPLLSLLVLVPFITFFFLVDSPRLVDRIIQNCPSRLVEPALHVATEIDTFMGNYVRSVLLEALAVALLAAIGLYALGLNYAAAIAALSGVLNLIPYAGAAVGGLAACAVALFQFKTFSAVAKVAAIFLGIRLADDLILQPTLSKYSVRLHPVVYLLALMIGGEAFGLIGLIFAIPTACLLKTLLRVTWDWYSTEALAAPDAPQQARIPYV